eukprot:scaffold65954_cov44-Phaeocystis_antarctica.AAC.2
MRRAGLMANPSRVSSASRLKSALIGTSTRLLHARTSPRAHWDASSAAAASSGLGSLPPPPPPPSPPPPPTEGARVSSLPPPPPLLPPSPPLAEGMPSRFVGCQLSGSLALCGATPLAAAWLGSEGCAGWTRLLALGCALPPTSCAALCRACPAPGGRE